MAQLLCVGKLQIPATLARNLYARKPSYQSQKGGRPQEACIALTKERHVFPTGWSCGAQPTLKQNQAAKSIRKLDIPCKQDIHLPAGGAPYPLALVHTQLRTRRLRTCAAGGLCPNST